MLQDVDCTQEKTARGVQCLGQASRSLRGRVPPWTRSPVVSLAPACPHCAQTGLSASTASALSFFSEHALGLGCALCCFLDVLFWIRPLEGSYVDSCLYYRAFCAKEKLSGGEASAPLTSTESTSKGNCHDPLPQSSSLSHCPQTQPQSSSSAFYT